MFWAHAEIEQMPSCAERGLLRHVHLKEKEWRTLPIRIEMIFEPKIAAKPDAQSLFSPPNPELCLGRSASTILIFCGE
jgi:hypothetical protein